MLAESTPSAPNTHFWKKLFGIRVTKKNTKSQNGRPVDFPRLSLRYQWVKLASYGSFVYDAFYL